MDFIERLFHLSPDGGSGATEATYIVAISVILVAISLRRPISRIFKSLVAREPDR
jgi:hypothetical protein